MRLLFFFTNSFSQFLLLGNVTIFRSRFLGEQNGIYYDVKNVWLIFIVVISFRSDSNSETQIELYQLAFILNDEYVWGNLQFLASFFFKLKKTHL